MPPDLGRLSLEMGECGRFGYGRKSRFLTGLSPGSEWQRVVVAEILHFVQDDKFVQDDRREDMVIWDECVYWGFDGCGGGCGWGGWAEEEAEARSEEEFEDARGWWRKRVQKSFSPQKARASG